MLHLSRHSLLFTLMFSLYATILRLVFMHTSFPSFCLVNGRLTTLLFSYPILDARVTYRRDGQHGIAVENTSHHGRALSDMIDNGLILILVTTIVSLGGGCITAVG